MPDIDYSKGRIKVLISLRTKASNGLLYKTDEYKSRNKKALLNINNELIYLKDKLKQLDNRIPNL